MYLNIDLNVFKHKYLFIIIFISWISFFILIKSVIIEISKYISYKKIE